MHLRRIRRRNSGPFDEIKSVLADVRSALTGLADSAEDASHAGALRVRASGRRAKRLVDHAGDRAEGYLEDSWDAIRAHPKITTTVIAAVGLGILAGIIISRRR